MSDARVTIFVSTFNRLQTLTRTLESYRRFTTPYEVVIVDNGTDHPACLEVLDAAEQRPEVRDVHHYPKITSLDELEQNVNRAIRTRFRQSPKTDWYAVTDADICFEGSSPGSLDAYIRLAEATGKCPGPHTRVDAGIPHGYPLRPRVLVCESRLLYRGSMMWHDDIPFSIWAIDSTFHIFPCQDTWTRLKMDSLRVGPPFDAMHLDWYMDAFNPTPENEIYLNSKVSSWGGMWLRGFWRQFQRSPETAFGLAVSEGNADRQTDLNNGYFMAAWCLQNGIANGDPPVGLSFRDWSVRLLDAAIPAGEIGDVYRPRRADWTAMIYSDDFSALGWEEACLPTT